MAADVFAQRMSTTRSASDCNALVFGASGQIGHFLLPHLREQGVSVEAVSRHPPTQASSVLWTQFDIHVGGDAARRPDLVFSAGPLDGLVSWLARTRHRPSRIVAFSSTSALSKQNSIDPEERALAERLLEAEASLAAYCQARGIAWTILRPTLIYGCGKDANLSRIAALARRWRCVPLPRHARGLRQPVHAQDLALGAWCAVNAATSAGKCYEVCGGETLAYDEMVRRTLACLSPPAQLVRVPSSLLQAGVWALSKFHRGPGLSPSMLRRMGEDLVFPDAAARRDFGWKPRAFEPQASDFPNP